MIPAAALAVVRAGVENARGNGFNTAEGVAEQVVEELVAMGWTIVLAGPDDHRQAA
ncbi:hypothetical protein JHN63_20460 [Streptomyces sp. MBT65]|uniref:hypothetical protein n=1 Tax=unclassified Streptomyces TaxID=2593676 RepID=UPI00190BE0C0|nr:MULTISPECIES: hypothetical protein [unclassified Streptomyces]MBK3576149.1 hypothetical protein [Streptomyces sp. MBT65]MBK3637223.1 hypothetical protein [Streptomyces sp. MBT97]